MKFLDITISLFFVLDFGCVVLDYTVNGSVSSRALLGSMAIAVIIVFWHRYRIRLQDRERQRSETLRRRARFHLNGNERGEAECGTAIIIALVVLAILAAAANLCMAAEDAIDQAITITTSELWPNVSLNAAEFQDLQGCRAAATSPRWPSRPPGSTTGRS